MNEIMFLGVPNWKWLALLGSCVFLFFFRSVVLWLLEMIKKTQVSFLERSFLQFFLDQKIEKAISWIVVGSGAFIVVAYLDLPPGFTHYIIIGLKLFLTYNIIRICYMAADALGFSMQEWARHTESEFDDHLAPFASRTLKVLVIVVGTLVGLQNFGVNVTALLAGLGIGGIALAFAAQDTVANVFGTITIILDRPFKIGDHLKIGDTEGTVEEVGFRSTRIRTFYNSVVSLPNSVVAKEKIDNFALRNGWIRFRHELGFTYDANVKQLGNYCEIIRNHLIHDPTVDHNRIDVHFNSFGESSLNVLVNFHYTVEESDTNMAKINRYLDFCFITAQECKLDFAFPTRTLLVQNQTKELSQSL